jgi:hypothetical protein
MGYRDKGVESYVNPSAKSEELTLYCRIATIEGPSPIRTRDWTTAARGCGIHCDLDAIRRTWLVHLDSAPLISFGRGEGRRAHLSPRKDTAARGRASTRLLDGISAPPLRSINRKGENTQFHPKSAERSAEAGCKYRAPIRSAAAALLG